MPPRQPKPKSITSLADLTPDPHNANTGTERGGGLLERSLRETGAGRSVLVDRHGHIISGNKTVEQWGSLADEARIQVVKTDGQDLVVVQREDLDLADPQGLARKLAYYDNRTSELNLFWDPAAVYRDMQAGVDLQAFWTPDELDAVIGKLQEAGKGPPTEPPEPEIDRAEELRQQYGVEVGQIWALRQHRVLCGDSRDSAAIGRLMQGAKALLCHADPPYGMGKEHEGIANDNLYGAKLDAFQMRWWEAARSVLTDNASVYVWGNAEDLWRWWYSGGLSASERMTFRNEIVWDKAVEGENSTMLVTGVPLAERRMYQPSERCLFFMLGEQGFTVNAENYWEGWEPIRVYLKQERDRMGWDNAKCKALAGHSPTSGCHWFDASQWEMPTQKVYESWQRAAKYEGFKRDYEGFKRDYEEIKREFSATRAYFDNTHDSMTDVWHFPRVTAEARWEHATPKPVGILARILQSSSTPGAAVVDPFLGSGTTLVACEQLRRQCYGIDIAPAYIAVTLHRWSTMTGGIPQRVGD